MATREMPTGTVTFLFTDVEGSTRLLQELGDSYVDLLQQHNGIVRDAIAEHGGAEIGTEGDSFFVVFDNPVRAVEAAARIQRGLSEDPFPRPFRVRMGLHTGEGRLAGDDYVGIDVHRAARVAAAGHGGQVLVSDATRALVEPALPEGVALRDLGHHRLKDLARPEHLYQLVLQGLPSEFPPPRSLDARPNNLPVQLTGFIGRQEEVSEVKRRLLNGVRLLTLTGPGGTGKTRLALEVAAEALTAFEDGAWFVDLAPITDHAQVVSAIAEILGVSERPGLPLQDALELSLRDRALLVILDNFEQVVEAGAAVERLLRAAPRIKVLVTSRAVLHRPGEEEHPVPPLDLPDPANLPDLTTLARYEAIHLFLERAAAVQPDFTLTAGNAPAVAAIAVRLDGLPLAIELAASRVKILTPQAILERLGRGSPVLISQVSDAPARQRTLRGAIEWSYELLEEQERVMFAQLSAFQAGATLEAIEAVCTPVSGVDALDGLASLVDKSLLRRVEAADGEPRFVMLETIRGFAGERLEGLPDLGDATRQAHAAHFADFAGRQWERLTGPAREQALAAMSADLDNLRFAWRHWMAERDLDRLNRLVDGLWPLYDARGWYHATIELTTDLLDVLSSTPSTPERAVQEVMLRTSLARALMAVHGYTKEVEEAYERALELSEGQRELPQAFPVLRGLASFYTYRAEFEKGAEVGRAILRLAEAQGDPSMSVDGHLVLGSSLAMHGELRSGLEELDGAIALFDAQGSHSRRLGLGNNPGVASLTTSSLVLWMLGLPDTALERANRAVAVADELKHPPSMAYARFHVGFLHLWRREPELARDRETDAVDVASEHRLQIWKAVGTCLVGAANAELGSFEEGLAQIQQGLALYEGLTTPPIFWPLLLSVRARAHLRSDSPAEGLRFIEDAIEIVGSGRTLLPEFLLIKGDLLRALPEPDGAGAAACYERAFEVAQALGARMSELRAANRLYASSGGGSEAERDRELRGVYDSFTEGFSTADLLEARALLQGY